MPKKEKNEYQIKILQLNLSKFKFLPPETFAEIIKTSIQNGLGVERDNYYILRTTAHVSWLQPTDALKIYHFLLRLCSRRGFNHLMIIKNK